MFRVVDEESLILKEDEPITLTEVATGRKRKLLLENKGEVKKQSIPLTEDFFNLIICTTSIARKLTETPKLEERETKLIETQKQAIIVAVGIIADILNLDDELSYNEVKTEKKKKLKEELKPVEYDVIPLLRFQEIKASIETIIGGYFAIGENLTYEKTREISTDLTRIENAIDNIATMLSEEVKNNLIYKK